jgi:DNA-binding transcriptional ArsR family regulator
MVKQHKSQSSRRPRHQPMSPDQIEVVAELFGVLSESTRLRILQLLQDEPRAVGEIVAELDLKQANVSKQLGILHAAAVLKRRGEGNRVIYSIAMPVIFDLCKLVCGQAARRAEDRAKRLRGAARTMSRRTE